MGAGDAGKTYLVDADGLIYVWDGTAWPAQGRGIVAGEMSTRSTRWRLAIFDGDYLFTDTYSCAAEIGMYAVLSDVNLCVGGAASASSNDGASYVASGAFDGDIETAWRSDSTLPKPSRPNPNWIEYHFTDPVCIESVSLTARDSPYTKCVATFAVQAYVDDAWHTFWEVVGQTGWAASETRRFFR